MPPVQSRAPNLTPGNVLRYTPEIDHCREGLVFVVKSGRALDTYWRPTGDGESHALTAQELEQARLVFNVEDFDALDRYSAASREHWKTYHPDDRARITSQHGLQEQLFVRKGAEPHLGTQIENAQAALERAEGELRAAAHVRDRCRAELEELEARRV